MKGLSLPNNISDALPALSELVRRAVDGSVPPLQIDVENQRILIRSTTASAATSLFEAALTTRWTTAGVTTWDSTANFNSAINVTGNTESTGTLNIKNWVTASALQLEATAAIGSALSGGSAKANSLYANNIVKAWARIDGNQAPASLTDSFNVSSITDNGAGDYTINWDTDFANTTYSVVGMAGNQDGTAFDISGPYTSTIAVGSFRVVVVANFNNSVMDAGAVSIVALGGQ